MFGVLAAVNSALSHAHAHAHMCIGRTIGSISTQMCANVKCADRGATEVRNREAVTERNAMEPEVPFEMHFKFYYKKSETRGLLRIVFFTFLIRLYTDSAVEFIEFDY